MNETERQNLLCTCGHLFKEHISEILDLDMPCKECKCEEFYEAD